LFDSDKNTWIAGYWRGARVSKRSPPRAMIAAKSD
jgi:hypothetical protein